MLLKLGYAKFGVSNLFKLSKKNFWGEGVGSTPFYTGRVKKPYFQNGQKNPRENRTNKDIILLILAKPLDKHGITLVHITYPPLISVLIFAMFLEIFTHVVGDNVFFQVTAVKIPWQSFYKNEKK